MLQEGTRIGQLEEVQHEGRSRCLYPPFAEDDDAELHEQRPDQVVDVHSSTVREPRQQLNVQKLKKHGWW